ncbi:hypothetical protein BRC71_03970 [Halobacteriales archaeon QH_7_65_31]|nr:MAG: hypothetical protein BRC71_03970 [Halobacteriales archaeon QH_7_65_31]
MTPLLSRLAALSPRTFESDDELSNDLELLGIDCAVGTWRQAGDGLAVLSATVGLAVTPLVTGVARSIVLAATLLLAAGTVEGTVRVPRLLAAIVRRRALGGAPWLVCRAAMRLRVTPTLEAAAVAATDSSTVLGRDLAASVRRGRATGAAGFDAFLTRWGEFSPLRRGVRLLADASRTDAADRPQAIDRALDAVLDGVRERAADDAAELRGPVTAVYAFGVLLPLAFVAALPAASVAGLPVSVPAIVLVYDIVLPVGLLAAGLRRRVDRAPVVDTAVRRCRLRSRRDAHRPVPSVPTAPGGDRYARCRPSGRALRRRSAGPRRRSGRTSDRRDGRDPRLTGERALRSGERARGRPRCRYRDGAVWGS